MECRINAEDPFRGFPLPSTGRLVKFQPPPKSPGQASVRYRRSDGGEISMFYDSMIAKLIVHGATREQAHRPHARCLNSFGIRGISSNIPFQAALMQHPVFHSGIFDTGFIPRHPTGFDASMVPHDDPAPAGFRCRLRSGTAPSPTVPPRSPASSRVTERIVGDQWMVVRLNKKATRHHPVTAMPDTRWATEYKGEENRSCPTGSWASRCSTAPATAGIHRRSGAKYPVQPVPLGHRADFMVMSARAAELLALMPRSAGAPTSPKFLMSPMPGLLREVAVRSARK